MRTQTTMQDNTQSDIHNTIHEDVRERYASVAKSRTSCCGPASSCGGPSVSSSDGQSARNGYSSAELSAIPADADLGLGCGNPQTIASLKEGEIVLDLGSGGGIDVFLAARQVGDKGYVYGIDMTDEMLELARNNAKKAGITNVEFRKGHIENIPVNDKSIDVIISNCVVNLSPDKAQVLNDSFRVLKPGGRVAISDIVIDGTLDDLPITETQIRQALSWAGCIAGALTVDQYIALLTEAGFERIDVDIRHHYTLEALGQDIENVAHLGLAPNVVHDLVGRFAGGSITAYRPA